MRPHLFTFAVVIMLICALSGCAPTQATSSTSTPTSRTEPSSAPATPAPTATVDQRQLKPGTNHNYAASDYVYSSMVISRCLQSKGDPKLCPNKKLAFLTIDDGPNSTNTRSMMDVTQRLGVPVTWFMVGQNVKEVDPALIKDMVARGDSIANHSYTHNMKKLYPDRQVNADRVMAEYEKTNQLFVDILGSDFRAHAFRYPGGHVSWHNTAPADEKLAEDNAYWVDWNSLAGDAEKNGPTTPSGMVERVQSSWRAEGQPAITVILVHDFPHGVTKEALPQIVNFFTAQGYDFATLD